MNNKSLISEQPISKLPTIPETLHTKQLFLKSKRLLKKLSRLID